MKWGAIATIEVVIDDPPQTVVLATPTPTPASAAPVITPRATPRPTPEVVAAAGDERRYGDARTLELGGSLDFLTGRVTEKSSVSKTSASGYTIDARPFVGYFVTPGFEIFGELIVQSSATNFHDSGDTWETFTELGAGGAYFFRRPSGVAFGPFARFQSYSLGNEAQDASGANFDFEERGWGGDAGLAVRVPIGPSALLSTSFSLYQTSYTWDYYPGGLGSKGDGARNGFDASVGVTMWIPK